MSIRWQDSITQEQWDEWLKLARKLSASKKAVTSLGHEDYAAQAIEKLLMQESRPANIDGWLALTISNQYKDRFRKIAARGGASIRDLSDDEWDREMISYAAGSPSAVVYNEESVTEVLSVLNMKEKEILILAAAGYDNHAIAMHLDYKTNKIVATRLAQIQVKVRKKLGLNFS